VRYLRAHWVDAPDGEPVEMWHEIGGDNLETRKVWAFRDGSLQWTDSDEENGTIYLASEPIPTTAEIDAMPEFTAVAIDLLEFEAVWSLAIGSTVD